AGFVAVILGRQQLFTENTLTAVLPALTHRTGSAFAALLRLWGFVLLGNIVGTWLFAALLTVPGLFDAHVQGVMAATAKETMAHPFWPTFWKAVLAGWIIALMVWLLPSSRSARFWVIIFMTWLIALGKLSHIIAGSGEAAYAVLIGERTIFDYLTLFFIPTLLGNVLGGIALVALLNHAPFSDELKNPSPEPSEHGPMAEHNPPA
ncbi:MAG TPA: formate/nitrite transporter family protein, partial [Caulobacteraceae bacterium]|nr:formate/nitrite transporter family protein [Caulobacteraceae bacterium]